MLDKRNVASYNDKKQPHGLWENYSTTDDSFCKLHFINGEIFGLLDTYNADIKQKQQEYYAR